jgi:hypothetical protein
MDNVSVTDDQEQQRHRGSQKARSHKVELGQCPSCGATIPARLVGYSCYKSRTTTKRSES